MALVRRPLGQTGMQVSALGFGAGPLGDASIDDETAELLLRNAIELGIVVFDTAPSYGASEARLGRLLASMSKRDRDELVIVTKGGYGVAGVTDWTPEVIERGVDEALSRLATDRIDVFLLHSCPRERLERGDLLAPLERVRRSGKVRAIGYSGDGDALAWAIRCSTFDVVECSLNIVDQEALGQLPTAKARGLGVIAKRALAGAPWRDPTSPYVGRWRAAFGDSLGGLDPDELAIRFAAYATGVDTALTGTRRLEHLYRAATYVARGPLPSELQDEIVRRFAAQGGSWPGII
ncbi:MAG TPA: aldo/keto reductase [Labilithrix sp.]|nr:aldo/keto reductase [Labilithrix sp.]